MPNRGFVWLIHGMGEHVGRYSEVAHYLNHLGYDVGGPDLPGHGMSRKKGGSTFIPTVDELNVAQSEILEECAKNHQLDLKNEKWFLLCHSMGALVGLAALCDWKSAEVPKPFKFFGIGPPLRIRKRLNPLKSFGVKLLTDFLPDLPIPNGEVAPEDVSYDISNYGVYRKDPLVHGFMNARQFDSWRIKFDELMKSPEKITTPVFLAAGEDDGISDPQAVKELFDRLTVQKRFLLVPNAKHELLFEYGREKVFQALVSWIS